MTPYREPEHEVRALTFEAVPLPDMVRRLAAFPLGAGLFAMLMEKRICLAWILWSAIGASLVAITYVPRRTTSVRFDRAWNELRIRKPTLIGYRLRTVSLSAIVELVTERSPLFVRVLLRTTSREEIVVWSGPTMLAGDRPDIVRDAMVSAFDEATGV